MFVLVTTPIRCAWQRSESARLRGVWMTIALPRNRHVMGEDVCTALPARMLPGRRSGIRTMTIARQRNRHPHSLNRADSLRAANRRGNPVCQTINDLVG